MTIDKSLPLDQQIANHLQRHIDLNGLKIEQLERIDATDGRKTNSTHNSDQMIALANQNRYLQKLLNHQQNKISKS